MKPPSLEKMDFADGFKVARIFRGLRSASGDKPNSADDLDTFDKIMRIKLALQETPKDWFLLYILGSEYLQCKKYALAVKTLEDAFAIKPHDIRSTFALATAYRHLSRAQFLGIPKEILFPKESFPNEFTWQITVNSYDPEVSNNELRMLGLTVDDVALKAMLLFEETLRLGVRDEEVKNVNESLQKMYADFPHLEIHAKNRKKPKYDTRLIRDGSGNVLNEALGHYTRLRFLTDTPPRYRFELGEVIRLCQWAISIDKKDGDVYVLLANAYSLLDKCVQSSMTDHQYYMRWAGAVIQYWMGSSIKQPPFTKNISIGEKLYESILNDLMFTSNGTREMIIMWMKTLPNQYLDIALSPASYGKIKEQLQSEPI